MARPGTVVRRLKVVVRTEGAKGLVGWIRENIRSEFIYWRFVCELATGRHGNPVSDQRWTETVLERDNLERLTQWRSLRPARSVPAWLWMHVERGLDLSYAAWCGRELAHICWVVRPGQSTSVPGWRLAAGEAELRSAYTFPEFRGRGLWKALVAFMVEDLRAAGYRRLYAHVAPENRASWEPLVRAGFHRVATVQLRKDWGRVRVVEYSEKETVGETAN